MGSLSSFRPPLHDCEWVGSRYPLPATVGEGDAIIHPEADIWLELPSGTLVGSQIIDPADNVPFGDSLRAAIEHPLLGPARCPARIRVPNERLAESIRGVAPGATVVVAPVPELDEAFEELSSFLGASSPYATYLNGGAVPPAVVAALFSAAAKLFRAAPWRHLSDAQIVRVDIPAAGVDGACLSIIGAAGESFGLLLFRSLGAYETFASGEPSPTNQPYDVAQPAPPAVLSVSFDRKKDLAPEMVKEIERHRWEVAGAKGYPVVLAFDADREAQRTTERDYRILTACTLAFVDFFAKHRDLFRDDFPEPTSETFEGDDGLSVTLTAPFGEELFLDEPFFAPEDAPPRVRVGRNDPCPCGSGKKYKKCHLAAESDA